MEVRILSAAPPSNPHGLARGLAIACLAALASLIGLACAETPREAEHFDLLFVGDVGYGAGYLDNAERLEREGYDGLFRELRPLLAEADAVVANLETPLTPLTESPLQGAKRFLHRADPERGAAVLAGLGIGILSLANNHALDFGPPGLATTRAALARHGLVAFGAGEDAAAALAPAVIPVRVGEASRRVAVFGALQHHRRYDEVFHFFARADGPGVAALSHAFVTAVRAHATRHPEDLVVAFPHWGSDYRWRLPSQATWARALLEAGADLVIGHGSHTAQEIERVKDRWILYGLGNFAFGAPGRFTPLGAHPMGLVVRLRFEAGPGGELEHALSVHALLSDNLRTGYRPRPLRAEEFARAVALLERRNGGTWEANGRVRAGSAAAGPALVLHPDPQADAAAALATEAPR